MKRPLALVGFTYLLALVAAAFFGEGIAAALALFSFAICIATLVVGSTRRGKVIPAAFLTAAVALTVFCVCSEWQIKPVQKLDGQDAVISGTICELPYESYGRYYYVLNVDQVELEGAPQSFRLRVSTGHALEAQPYDRITGRVHFFLPEEGQGVSSRTHYASKGLYLLSYLYEYEPVQITERTGLPLYGYALECRKALLTSLRIQLPKEYAALSGGVLLGDKQGLSQQVENDFRDTGVAHLLAVSGLHITMLGQFLLLLLLALRLPKRLAGALAALGVLCFMAVTGFTPSAVRAGVMSILFFLGLLLQRQTDPFNSLGAAVLVLTLPNPFAAGDVGLLLSFSATLGIILISGKMKIWLDGRIPVARRGRRLFSAVNTTLATTCSAVLFTLPVILLTFRRVSLIAPVSNLLLVLPAMGMLGCAACASVLFYAGPLQFLAQPFSLLTGLLDKFILFCVNGLAKLPFASVSAAQDYLLLWAAGTLALIAVAFSLRRDARLLRVTALLSCILLLTGVHSGQLLDRNVTHVAVLNTGDGCSVLLQRNGRGAVLSCGGNGLAASETSGYLQAHGVTQLDYLMLPSLGKASASGAEELIRTYRPSLVCLPKDDGMDEGLERSLEQTGQRYQGLGSVRSVLWGDLEIATFLDSEQGWCFVTAGAYRILICPSALDARAIPEQYRSCDFLIATQMPAHAELLRCGYTLLTTEEEEAMEQMRGFTQNNGQPLFPAYEGTMVIDLPQRGPATIRRER